MSPRRAIAALALGALCALIWFWLSRPDSSEDLLEKAPRPPVAVSGARSLPSPPELLHLPDADDLLPPLVGDGLLPGAPRTALGRCPPEMVDVRGQFCVDRFEVSLVDAALGRELSPFYHPTRAHAAASVARYSRLRRPLSPGLPELPRFELEEDFLPRARALPGVTPQGYLSGDAAELACRNAGKRLCSRAEWLLACRGERATKFPYGERYAEGSCNVFREAHPAVLLHGDASREHLDPRLNQAQGAAGPLLRPTGTTRTCRSVWGADAAYDMVGNLDEWVSDAGFVGGFYARATREGCDARVASHPPSYFDYSLGTRCCR